MDGTRAASVVVRRSLQRAGVECDTLTSLFCNAACEAVLACLISDTTGDRVTRQQATHTPSQCTVTQAAAHHAHHTTPFSCSDRNRPHEQATLAGPGALLKTAASRASLACLLWPLSFPIFSSSSCCFHPLPASPVIPISSLDSRPRPQTALQLLAHSVSPPPAHFPRRHDPLLLFFVSTVSVLAASLPLADCAVGVCPSSSVLTEAETSPRQ